MGLSKKNKFFRVSKSFKFKDKKGFFFTIDALLAASILLGGLLLLSSYYINTEPTVHLNYLAQDIISSLDVIKINELNNSYVDELIANENITNLNNSILQQAGEFWALGKYTILPKFMSNVTQNIIPERYGFGLWIDGDLIYQRDNPPPSSRSTSRKLVSGVEKNKPIDGYIAKAKATSYTTIGTDIISFPTSGSGWKGSQVDTSDAVIDRYFEVLDGVNITNATFYISLHIQSGGADWDVVNINNGTCIITKDDLDFDSGDGVFDKKNIMGCFDVGLNHVQLRLRNLGYNAHVHPGTLIKIDYTLNTTLLSYENEFNRRYYFDNIVSYEGSSKDSGVWQMVPFFIPENAINVSVNAQIRGRNIRDYTGNVRFYSWNSWKRRRDYDYMLFVNENTPFDSDNHPITHPSYDYSNSQLESKIVTGTNVVTVYFNNYGDYAWGSGMPQIYSDEFNDPTNSSYIDVNYSLESPEAPYASIKVMQVEEFGGVEDSYKETSFSFPQGAAVMGNTFLHLVQQYSYLIDIKAGINTPPLTTIFASPSSRAVPTTTYIPKNVLDLSPIANNYVSAEDSAGNDILPDSAIEYSFYVPSLVGYDRVFANQTDAEDDALDRLNELLGDFISAENIVVESNGMTGVPTMWGPTIMEVRVWH